MSYIDKNLLPDEQIIYRTKKHPIVFLEAIVWSVAAIILLFVPHPYATKIALLFALIALFYWLYNYLNYSVAEFAVTTKRIMMREGFFQKHTNETRLVTIANVNVDQTLIGQLLDYGIVIIKTYGGDDDPFMDIPEPFAFKKSLELELDRITSQKPT